MLTEQETKVLTEAWELKNRLLDEIIGLAHMNPGLAYGLCRSAETMTDMIVVENLRRAIEQEAKVKKPEVK